ncbi:Hypothetical protein ACI5QL_04228 [Bacillus velezensis]
MIPKIQYILHYPAQPSFSLKISALSLLYNTKKEHMALTIRTHEMLKTYSIVEK